MSVDSCFASNLQQHHMSQWFLKESQWVISLLGKYWFFMPFDNEKKKIFPFIGDVTILAPFNVRVQLSSFCFSSRFLTIWLGCRCEIFGEWSSIADATYRDGIRAIALTARKLWNECILDIQLLSIKLTFRNTSLWRQTSYGE